MNLATVMYGEDGSPFNVSEKLKKILSVILTSEITGIKLQAILEN
jgi:hypothetical protein